jgi:hypothetical protein
VWLDRNLGATQVATSLNDSDAYGDLYQWGRAKDGHEKSSTTTIASSWQLEGARKCCVSASNTSINNIFL